MKKFLVLSLCGAASSAALAAENDLQKRVEALEFQSFENSLQWSGFLENRYDLLTVKPNGADKYNVNLNRMVAGIDFKAKPLANVSVFGRLAYSNVYNNYAETNGSTNPKGRPYNSSFANIERLFINYSVTDSLSFSVGRLPTLDGPPAHVYDGLSRQGSYPKQVYSSILDGYAATYKIPLGSDTQNLSARFIYTPLSMIKVTESATAAKPYDRDPMTSGGTAIPGEFNSTSIPLTSWMLDYNWSGSKAVRDLSVIYQGFTFTNFKLAPGWKFNYTINTLYIEAKDIASLGLTAYTSYSKTQIKNTGGLTVAPGVDMSLGAMKKDNVMKGTAAIYGLTYNLPIEAIKNPILGYEVYSADKDSVQFEQAGADPMAFYAQRGKGFHIFYSQPLNANMKLRIGMMDSKPEYNGGLPNGAVTETKDSSSSMYVNLRTDF